MDCKKCSVEFEITSSDKDYYKKIQVSEPTQCPTCRAQRRLAWRNERRLYKAKSELSETPIISIISPDKKYKVYEKEEWWSDAYNPTDFGRDFDFEMGFFEQFDKLMHEVPHMNMIGSNNENCSYCHLLANCKNCYMIVESSNNEDCMYGYWLQKCTGCVDTSFSHECQYCYEVDNCYNCYNLKWSRDCQNCSDSYFLKNCIGCKNCFGCLNLHHKEYFVFNEQKTKKEYEDFIKKINFEDYDQIAKLKEGFHKVLLANPHRFAQIINSEDCTGDYILNSRHCHECYHAHDAEYCKYGEHVWRGSKYNMDVSTAGRNAELIYEAINTGIDSYNVQFAVQNWTCSDMQYCYGCFNSSNNFGCVGLKRQKYCILNKQYSKEEYEELRDKIIDHMKEKGEYGEFFPMEISPFGYNETVAHEQYPLKKDYAPTWSDYESPKPEGQDAVTCEVSGRLFKIIESELEFYKKHKVPQPRKHPDARHLERMQTRNANKLWDRKCDNCKTDVKTTFNPNRSEKIYCEKCYLQLI